eukprot:TRINITY_DN6142_c0_g1_i2.p1 TRINITY_DN6142_c0_g1~~TRINITY_DN6142_c0_g1_i2.p1  ORF type:complete len:602 (+),score=118.50 TRINITY_DN6142_c0_g1_i2:54-1859(+)
MALWQWLSSPFSQTSCCPVHFRAISQTVPYIFTMAPTSRAFFASAISLFFVVANGNAFRGNLRAAMSNMSSEHIRATVLSEVMSALGSGNRVTEKRLANIEEALKPTFTSMPKNEHGKLDDAAARYVLHRLFVQRHGMYIKGLEPDGFAWNASTTTTEVLDDHIPAFVLSLFEERLKDTGLGMHELAVLAATLEHLIHDEAVDRLSVSYGVHNLSQDAHVGEIILQDLIDTYMTIFIKGAQQISVESVAESREKVVQSYPGWHATQKFTAQIRSGYIASRASEPNFTHDKISFQAAAEIVEEIGERYGRWQDSECRDLKESLLKIEHRSSGQVLLKDFYGAALSGQWQFSESVDFLRDLGALEESNPSQMAVMIPNYINAYSNCVASSSIFSVCCINECESLMGHLERQIAAPEASAGRILEIVAQLPSATVVAPRELPQELRSRLEEVASHHGGSVPLHGRLFAQWLHHAYPRECPYPHASGKVKAITAQEWAEEQGVAGVTESKAVMQRITEEAERYHASTPTPPMANMLWSHEEELVSRSSSPKAGRTSWMRSIMLFTAAASFCIAIVRMMSDTLSGTRCSKTRDSLLPSYTGKQHAC